jgi:hypothetical protein
MNTRTPEAMRLYQQKRRARLKAEAEAGALPMPRPMPKDHPLARYGSRPEPKTYYMGRPLNAEERRDDAEMEAIEARGGRPEWDHARDRWRDGAAAQPASSRALAISRPPLQGEILPPPRSMIASGGTPPHRYPAGAGVAEATAMIRAYAAAQAQVNAETERRLATLEQRERERSQAEFARADKRAKIGEFSARGLAIIGAFAGW